MPRRNRARSGIVIDNPNYFSIDKPKVAGVERHLGFRKSIDQTIEHLGGPEFELAFAFAFEANSVNDVVPVTPELDHLRNYFGWILQVGVDDNDRIAGGFFESGSDSDLVTEVA